jgi:hypothetical protein
MTLVLVMSKAEGVYLSVDYRVTELGTGRLLDDESIKFLQVTYPPLQGGPRALLAYTGLARLPGGTSMGDWIRETLRGETEYFDQSMSHLLARLNRDVLGLNQDLIINVVVAHAEKRYVGGFTNLERDVLGGVVRKKEFGYSLHEVTEPVAFVNGSGGIRALADGHMERIRPQLGLKPRRVKDHMKLLATINRRVAAEDQSVSPFCHVTFMPADADQGFTSHTFARPGESAPFTMPMLVVGLDLTEFSRDFHRAFEAFKGGDETAFDRDVDRDVANERLKRRP